MIKMLFDFVVISGCLAFLLLSVVMCFFSWLNLREEPKENQ